MSDEMKMREWYLDGKKIDDPAKVFNYEVLSQQLQETPFSEWRQDDDFPVPGTVIAVRDFRGTVGFVPVTLEEHARSFVMLRAYFAMWVGVLIVGWRELPS